MKHTILILLSICFATTIYSQTFDSYITLVFEDAIGQRDTILFGSDFGNGSQPYATVGVDTAWGEVDIYGTPYNNLDVRIIQRDSLQHNCLMMNPSAASYKELYSPYNLDMKVDFRPFNGAMNHSGSYFNNIEENFEIDIQSNNYPITVTFDTTVMGNIVSFYFLDSACAVHTTEHFYNAGNVHHDTLIVLTNPTHQTIHARFEIVLPTQQIQQEELDWTIFPNPAGSSLTIEGASLNGKIEISNALGQLCHQEDIRKNNQSIDISPLGNGLYFIIYHDERSQQKAVKSFVKQQ